MREDYSGDRETDCRVPTVRGGLYIEPVPLFWLNYRDPDGRAAGVVVMRAQALIAARLKAAVVGLDQGFDFADGHQLEEMSARHIPDDMIGRLLGESDLLRLLATTKKPPAPSIRRRAAAKRSARR